MGEVISSRKFNFSILKVSVSSNERKEKEIYERGRRISLDSSRRRRRRRRRIEMVPNGGLNVIGRLLNG